MNGNMTTMKTALCVLLTTLALSSLNCSAKSLTDRMIEQLIDNRLPEVLHSEQNKPWEFGLYTVHVTKNGALDVHSDESSITISLPVEVDMKGKIDREMLGFKATLDCVNAFTTTALIKLTPNLSQPTSQPKAEISVPVPETQMDCKGVKMPVQVALENLITNQKKDWEAKVEQEILAFIEREQLK